MSEEGGTKIQRRNVQQIPQEQQMQQTGGMSPQQQQMMMQQQQMMMQQQMGQQQGPPPNYQQQQQYLQQPQQQMQQQMQQQIPKGILKKPPKRFGVQMQNKNVKNSLIVVVIFILLNSKMIWRALSKVPMMGTVEPSILALLVNSLLAGIVFYIMSTRLNKL